jgi:hypothetical protein
MANFRISDDRAGQHRLAEHDRPAGPAFSHGPARVCLLIGQLGLGGTEKQVVLLAQGLRDRGIDATVTLMFEGGPREEDLRAAGVPVVHLGFVAGAARPRMLAANVAAFGRLVRHLRRLRPDVLHAFLFPQLRDRRAGRAAGGPGCWSPAAAAWVTSSGAARCCSRSSASRPG